jgi:hypothetical protein
MSDKPAKAVLRMACALLLAAGGVQAQADDPLKSPACAEALAGLQAARGNGAAGGQVESLRGAAAAACLGSAVLPARPSRIAQQPIVVPPPQVEVPARPAPPPAPALPPPPVEVERAPGPALCDAAGCWTQGGSHLRHVPSVPGSLCTTQGTVVNCP